jgi:hypothetical protein
MKKMRKKALAAVSASLMLFSLLSACGSVATDEAQSGENQTADTAYPDYINSTVAGQVQSIDGDVITLLLGDLSEAAMSGGAGGAPSGETRSGGAPSGGAPSGEAPSGEAPAQTDSGAAPEMPSNGDSSGGMVPGGQTFTAGDTTLTITITDESVIFVGDENTAGTLEDIAEGDILSLTFDEEGKIESVTVLDLSFGAGAAGGMGGSASSDISYTAANECSEDTTYSGETIVSSGTDENAVLVNNGAIVSISDSDISRDSDDSTGGDNSSFYGVGAAVLTTDGTTYISDSTITTDASGGAGVFAYGDGTAYVADTAITTEQDTSGGIHAAGGGKLYAWDLNVETQGNSSAAIRSDRGGGTMVIDGGSYVANGTGSPAVYCTADIAINNATLTATNSEAVCIEGLNNLYIFNSDLTGDIPESEQNDCDWTVIVYQRCR